MAHIDLETQGQVTAALLQMRDLKKNGLANEISGFTPPANYLPIAATDALTAGRSI